MQNPTQQITNARTVHRAKTLAYQEAYERTDSFRHLIEPSEVLDGASHWSDISMENLDTEAYVSLDHMEYRHKNTDLVDALAYRLWRNSLTRAPLDDLRFDDYESAMQNGYWCNSVDKWECNDMLHERGIDHCEYGHELRQEALQIVEKGMTDAMNPKRGKEGI